MIENLEIVSEKNYFGRPKKEYPELIESKYVKKWIESYTESQRQKKLGILEKYVEFIEKSPDDLIIEHNNDIRRDDPIKITNIAKKQLFLFYKYLIGEEVNGKVIQKAVSINSARQYIFSVLTSFFSKNNIPINFNKNEIPKERKGIKDKVWRSKKERISQDDKKKSLKKIRDDLTLLRDRAILHCKISSGMDDVDLFKLKIKDFERGYYPDYNICYIEGNRTKSDIRFQTFFNGEACSLIKIYLNDRKKKGEKMDSNSWLFVSNYLKPNGTGKKMKPNAFSKNLRETCEKLEIYNITPKALRSYFNTIVIRALHDDKEIVERMMGHVGSVSSKYQQMFNDTEEFAKYYYENIDLITSLENTAKTGIFAKKEMLKLREQLLIQDQQIRLLLQEKLDTKDKISKIEKINEETEAKASKLEKEIQELKNLIQNLSDKLDS
ncbi:MAG: hypothetical protein ACFFAO_03600 [Candidatus Hermodarchaeota archaeon]